MASSWARVSALSPQVEKWLQSQTTWWGRAAGRGVRLPLDEANPWRGSAEEEGEEEEGGKGASAGNYLSDFVLILKHFQDGKVQK